MSTGFQNPTSFVAGSNMTGLGGMGAAIRYPHPFFDVAQTYLPMTVKHLFRWCHVYYQQDGLVNTVVNKMAQYPVTELVYKASNIAQENLFESILDDHLKLGQFCIACNVDYYVYGNAYVSVHFPIIKYLECPHCEHKSPADSVNYRFENFTFKMDPCPKCNRPGDAIVTDVPIRVRDKIKLIRWNPQDIDVFYNEVTGDASYVLKVPDMTSARIREGNPLYLNTTPQVYINAVAKGQRILLSQYNVFHMRRENVAGQDMGIGQPLVVPVLKDLYLKQVLRKSQEAIAHEHIVPLRIIHPAASGQTDPIRSMDLGSWQSTMRSELLRWRQDPNYTPIVPLPIGFQYMGGQGKSLMLTNELRQISEMIVSGMNVPVEFVFGGMSFSGSSVSLRMLENQFLRNQAQLTKLVRFVINSVARFLGVDPCSAEFVSIRTADDVQRKQLLLQMAQTNKISDDTLLSEFNIDAQDELKKIEEEQKTRSRLESKQFLNNAENQGQALLVQSRYQARAQSTQGGTVPGQEGQAPGQEAQGSQALDQAQAQELAKKLKALPPQEQATAMEELKQYVDQNSWMTVQTLLQQEQQAPDQKKALKPAPEKLPPRRSAGNASI